jgi:hypothetical protein
MSAGNATAIRKPIGMGFLHEKTDEIAVGARGAPEVLDIPPSR